MVVVVLLVLVLGVLQVGLYAHTRAVVTASAAEGARAAAAADVRDPGRAEARTRQLVAESLGSGLARDLDVDASVSSADGLPVLVVDVRGQVPTVLAPLGDVLPLRARGRALLEGVG